MSASPIDIAENAGKGVAALPNGQGAGLIDLKLSRKHARPNVSGPHVLALHEMSDPLQAGLAERIDVLAERITALGGRALETVQTLGSATRLGPLSEGLAGVVGLLEAHAERTAALGASVRKGTEEATEIGAADAADLLRAVTRRLHRTPWLLEAHLQLG